MTRAFKIGETETETERERERESVCVYGEIDRKWLNIFQWCSHEDSL